MTGGPMAKVDRANEHVERLADLIRTFASENYAVDAHPYMWEPDFWKEVQWGATAVIPIKPPTPAGDILIFAEARADPPDDIWGPLIGDIVHNLRSALDQLVWRLSIDFQPVGPPPDPIPFGDPWRGISFPIRVHQGSWSTVEARQLWAIDPNLLATIKRLQPFESGKNAPSREPLAVLEELWNIDKHRHLHLVNASIELAEVVSIQIPGLPDIGDYEVITRRAPGPLVGRTEIGRARHVPVPGGVLAMSAPQMTMDPTLAVDVAFGQGAPAYGEGVVRLLSKISKTVENVVAAFPSHAV